MALGKCHSFIHEPIRVRRIEMRVSERGNRVVALLIGDDENDVGTFHRVDGWVAESFRR